MALTSLLGASLVAAGLSAQAPNCQVEHGRRTQPAQEMEHRRVEVESGVEIDGRVNQGQVGECLREVVDLATSSG